MRYIHILSILIASLSTSFCVAQVATDSNLVQLSGLVLDGSDAELYPVPYTNILVKEKSRGTFTDFKGFFSVVVEKGDVVEFSAIGYKTIQFTVPDTLEDNRYSVVQLMTQDTFNLP